MSTRQPTVIVCAGGGGVGKTTTSAALALALARRGKRTLVVTIDPARRLADALQVPLSSSLHRVDIEAGCADHFDALMPEPDVAARAFMRHLFAELPDSLERLVKNQLFLTLEDKLAGTAELTAMTLVMRAVDERAYDCVVIDTAPSRFALDFLTYPARLSQLLEGRALKWIAGLVMRLEEDPSAVKKSGGISGWGKRKAEAALSQMIGYRLLYDTAEIFGEFVRARRRFAMIATRLGELLLGPQSRYVVVAAPTGAAEADALFILERLHEIGLRPSALIANRASTLGDDWHSLAEQNELDPALRTELLRLLDERMLRQSAARALLTRVHAHEPGMATVLLPKIEAIEPLAIVRALADRLDAQLDLLAGI